MKTCLYTPCYLIGKDALGNDRFERNKRYIKYYLPLKKKLGFDHLWLADNCSPWRLLQDLRGLDSKWDTLQIHRFDEHLARRDGPNGYIYCWRALDFIRDLIEKGYEKIICIDSDCFILSQRFASYIKCLDSGWVTFWSDKYRFPTAECHILCKDAFPILLKFTEDGYEQHLGKLMEWSLPFTHIEKSFHCDRWGEDDTPITSDMDAYFQARLTMPLEFPCEE